MIEYPYGIADFHRIRKQGYLYVDRTAHISKIERLGSVLVFLRPRRFGKSLWLQTLANYYDLQRKDEFDQLFGDLAVGHQPTSRANTFFVLQWNFSTVSARGDVTQIAENIRQHVQARAKVFMSQYRDILSSPIDVDGNSPAILDSLLAAVSETPHPLYLLIDEYDNFVNDVMVQNVETYRALFEKAGPYKELFKSVKNALEGKGMERAFVTGVSPVALNDLTSGFNNSKNVSLDPDLASLCGFRESEIRGLLVPIAEERNLSSDEVEQAMDTMRTWYNGYRFSQGPPGIQLKAEENLVYNPTNTLYFLEHLYRWGVPPQKLHDANLRTDRRKLTFLAHLARPLDKERPGSRDPTTSVIEQLTEGDGEVVVNQLHESFMLDELVEQMGEDADPDVIASFLYYMGLLTLSRQNPSRLIVPNLVVRKLFLDRLLNIYLPKPRHNHEARRCALNLFQTGDIAPLLEFFEEKLLPVLSNRDRGAAPKKPGHGGSGVNEMVIKSLFLSILFDDQRYVTFSELELARGYADLCLLVRPEMRTKNSFDLLFEFKLVRRKELKLKGQEIQDMDGKALRRIPQVKKALVEARGQIQRYQEVLEKRFGAAALNLRSYVVVAVGLERLVGEEVTLP